MQAVFVTGTDTGVGKTLVCGLLGRYLIDKSRSVITQKWIQTGSDDFSEDIVTHLALMGRRRADVEKYLPCISPYTFQMPASPHLAAAAEGKKIDPAVIKNSFMTLSKAFDTVIVEGTGGALVPFNEKDLVIDIAKELDLPVIIVVKNKLGAINHTLLTIEAVKARDMKLWGVIFNSQKNENRIIENDNPKIIRTLTQERILGTLPWLEDAVLLQRAFTPVGDNILRASINGSEDE